MKCSKVPALMLLSVLCLTPSLFAARPQGNTSSLHEDETIRQILDLERQAKEASLRRDAAFPERALADDYIAITPLGEIVTKADAVSARRRNQVRYDAIEVSEMVVRVYGSTAVVTARAEVRGTDLGEDFSGPYRYTRVWVRRNGHWQTVSYQATVTR